MADLEGFRVRLEELAEELADAALEELRRAADTGGGAEAERRLTRARRAVERAAAALREPADDESWD